jgi:hypothetical protein
MWNWYYLVIKQNTRYRLPAYLSYIIVIGNLNIYMYNKMNCELMLTYDTPAYMFNVYKNQLSR